LARDFKEMTMKKETILVIALVLLCASSLANAWEFGMAGRWEYKYETQESDHFVGNLGVDYSSRNIFRGSEFYRDDGGAFSTSLGINLGKGFHADTLWTRPTESGNEYWEWLAWDMYWYPEDYFPCWWEDEDYAFQPRIGWRYYYFPDGPIDNISCCSHWRSLDFQEFYARFTWPRLCPCGIVPYYEAARIWPSSSGTRWDGCPRSYWRTYGGWYHTFGFYKDWSLPEDVFSTLKPRIRFGYEMVYNDGAGPPTNSSKTKVDHDWSHCNFNLSTNLELAKNISLSGGFNYQVTMDDSVNRNDECWLNVGTRIRF